MDIDGDLIWGDENESEVFAQAQSHDLSLSFRFSRNLKLPHSFTNRIITCFHELPTRNTSEMFPDLVTMREAVWSSIRQVWYDCSKHPSVPAADILVEIYEDEHRQTQWRISHESSFNQYFDSLLSIKQLLPEEWPTLPGYQAVNYTSLIPIRHLSGRGGTMLVRASKSDTLHVFKGIEFGAYLESVTNFKCRADICYHEIRTTRSLPPHPNIMIPSNIFVTVDKMNDAEKSAVCGILYPFMENGSLNDRIKNAQSTSIRISPMNKAKWCFQMASAIAHTHFEACSYHMDIKADNFLLNQYQDLILIDWEQAGAPRYILAPEADGSWDVKEVTARPSSPETKDLRRSELVYEKYQGPDRVNLPWGSPKWNVFPIWRESCPRALHAAETFSLGILMWMLLEQVTDEEAEEMSQVVVSWNKSAVDIPKAWRDVVCRCVNPDPNKRIELLELVDFWRRECADVDDAATYNSLPELNAAKAQLDEAGPFAILVDEIGKTFVKHGIHLSLGLVLLHNHFLLDANEMLVTVDSVAVPWNNTSGAPELSAVTPIAWRFIKDKLVPYEFGYLTQCPAVEFHGLEMTSFLHDLAAILRRWNLTDVLGICDLGKRSPSGPVTMDITSGRANITLPFDISPNDGDAIDAMWEFSSALSNTQG
ncbi:MAG: hypothetical protein Q9219_006991 [cf. Caloplaca sp. 3 TL-2023]